MAKVHKIWRELLSFLRTCSRYVCLHLVYMCKRIPGIGVHIATGIYILCTVGFLPAIHSHILCECFPKCGSQGEWPSFGSIGTHSPAPVLAPASTYSSPNILRGLWDPLFYAVAVAGTSGSRSKETSLFTPRMHILPQVPFYPTQLCAVGAAVGKRFSKTSQSSPNLWNTRSPQLHQSFRLGLQSIIHAFLGVSPIECSWTYFWVDVLYIA